jgi:hypothetical protein
VCVTTEDSHCDRGVLTRRKRDGGWSNSTQCQRDRRDGLRCSMLLPVATATLPVSDDPPSQKPSSTGNISVICTVGEHVHVTYGTTSVSYLVPGTCTSTRNVLT